MGRPIDADKLSADMYHEAFEKDSDMQKWDSGCWIRYKMFENVLKAQPTVEAPDINVGSMDTTTHDSIPAETGKNDGEGTSGDCISRQQAIDALLGITAMRNTIPLDSAIFNIKKLPSTQPERPTGEWIQKPRYEDDEYPDAQPNLKCPFCGYEIGWCDMGNYCARCGADLRGDENE